MSELNLSAHRLEATQSVIRSHWLSGDSRVLAAMVLLAGLVVLALDGARAMAPASFPALPEQEARLDTEARPNVADSQATDPVAAKSVVFIYRPKRSEGGWIKVAAHVDGVRVAELGNASYVRAELEPGRHTFESEVKDAPVLAIDLAAGKEYYLQIDIEAGRGLRYKGTPVWLPQVTGYSEFTTGELSLAREITAPSLIVDGEPTVPGSTDLSPSTPTSQEVARAYFFASKGGFGSHHGGWVSVDQARIDLRDGEYVGVALDPGGHTVQVGKKGTPFDIYTAPGQEYFFWVGVQGILWVPSRVGVAEIRQGRLERIEDVAAPSVVTVGPPAGLDLLEAIASGQPLEEEGQALVTVFRPKTIVGKKPPLSVNNHQLLELRSKQCVKLRLEPGVYSFASHRPEKTLEIFVHGGEEYAIRMDVTQGMGPKARSDLVLLSREMGYTELNWYELEPVDRVDGPYSLVSTDSCKPSAVP